ncbi:MAG TPA: hypothetical protein VML58_21870 [Burkholderiaceae bacterium]|nr:hypothetical protein [Burkholderiaceae bacterium]
MTAWRGAGWVALVGACAGLLSACVVAPAGYYDGYYYNNGYYYSSATGEAATVSTVAPPAPYYEVVPVAPFVGAVWFAGYWNWYGGHYAWVPGRWGYGRPGYAWHPYHWAPYGGRWALSGGWGRGR